MVIPAGYVWVGRCQRCCRIIAMQPTTEHDWLFRCGASVATAASFPASIRCDGPVVEFQSPLREICQAAFLTGGVNAVVLIVRAWDQGYRPCQ